MIPTRCADGSRPASRSAACQGSSDRPRGPCGSRFAHSEAAELVRGVAEPDADLHPPAADVVEHREVLGQADRMVERQQADVARKPHVPGARRHRAGNGDPRRQVAVIDEVMFREPHEVDPEPSSQATCSVMAA